ncbi:MAG: Mrp/NBP35 family ATP-binding protein [Pseudomonadota bacterium]
MRQVKNTIAFASGKGGVGKSTTTVNVAVALAARGLQVGVMDADIYGPSVAHMLGTTEVEVASTADGLIPVVACGLESMSIAYLATNKMPLIWRGPMASGALAQMLERTVWGELDFLLIDMPPGTGDIQLTLSQKVALTGAVIVTTPQDVALIDARKGIDMFAKVEVPLLGLIENMAQFVCSKCGHCEAIFGTGGGQRVAEEYGIPLLASLPLLPEIRIDADNGVPAAAQAGSQAQSAYGKIADGLLEAVNQPGSPAGFPTLSKRDD